MNYVILILPALIVMFIMKIKYDKQISTKELLIHFGICLITAGIVLGISYAINYSALRDTQILNGKVLNKYKHIETCDSQSSSCENYTWHERCHYEGSGKNRQQVCISYKVFFYPFEIDWYIQSNLGDFKIRRVNDQGTISPPRWLKVQKGDYASVTSSYMNYLLADKNSLFSSENDIQKYDQKYLDNLPKYPGIYDYYDTYHVINTTKVDSTGFDEYLKNQLKDLGSQKQVNIQVLIYNYKDVDFVDAVLLQWRGGKKNDVIMFFGVDEEGTVQKFTSTSFAKGMKNEELHSTMRIDALKEKLTLELLAKEVDNVRHKFVRLPNESFSYMAVKMEPRKDAMVIASILLLILSYFVGRYMRDNEV